MKKSKNIFWGILFLLGAVAVIISKLGYLQEIGFWSVLITAGLAGLLVDGMFKRSWGQILFSLAFIGIVNAKLLGIENLVPWTLLLAALLGTIGLNMLFPRRRHGGTQHYLEVKDAGDERHDEVIEEGEDEVVHYKTTFGSAIKYVNCQQLKYAHLESSFGSLEVYFDNTLLKNHAGFVKAEQTFGVINLYIPAEWKVSIAVNNTFGRIEEFGCCNPEGTETLTVTGDVFFGSLQIHYI